MTLASTIDALPDDKVFEVARAILPDLLGVYEPDEAPERAGELLRLNKQDLSLFTAEATKAAKTDVDTIADLLRLVLKAASDDVPEARMREAIADAGKRFTVVGIDLITLGVFLLVGYVAVRTGGKESSSEQIDVQIDENHKLKITHKIDTKYINPLSFIGTTIQKIISRSDS